MRKQTNVPADSIRHRAKSGQRRYSTRPLRMEVLERREVLSNFGFVSFDSTEDLMLVGDAGIADGRLRLTPTESFQTSAVWHTDKQIVSAAFETTFQFQLPAVTGGHGEGFAFVIQNSQPHALGAKQTYLGYGGIANSLAIEFDTARRPNDDPNDNHIAVHSRGALRNDVDPEARLATVTPAFNLNDGNVHTGRIRYEPGSLSVFVDDLQSPALSIDVDLNDLLDLDFGSAWIGFTSTTFNAAAAQDILSWSFDSLLPSETVIAVEEARSLEGHNGTTRLEFEVRRTGNLSDTVILDWSTENGTALAGYDFAAAAGQIVFQPDEGLKIIGVDLFGDTIVEGHETFYVNVALASGSASLADSVGVGRIENDETTVTISDALVIEGNNASRFIDAFANSAAGDPRLNPVRSLFGPDLNGDGNGELYVASGKSDEILLYDGLSGAFLKRLVADDPVTPDYDESGGLDEPFDLAIDAGGGLLAISRGSANILRYDSATGAFLGVFASDAMVEMDPRSMCFGPDVTSDGVAELYVTSPGTSEILRFNGASGELIDAFVAANAGGIQQPMDLAFGPDGALYVTDPQTGQVFRFHGVSGAFQNIFAAKNSGGLGIPWGMTFGPDGNLYVGDRTLGASKVLRFHGQTGAFLDTYVPAAAGGLDSTHGLDFGPDGNLYVASSRGIEQLLRFGAASQAVFTVSLAAPSAVPVTVGFATGNGSAGSGSDYTTATGVLTFAPGETVKKVTVKTLDDAVYESGESFTLNLSNASAGATIVDGQAMGTILDNDPQPTKFYVVNDATTNGTYEYGDNGTPLENYALNSGNAAPRGAASTVAGDKVWVVDANRKVYVYDAAGGLLGSWTAGSLANNASVQGIATNGTDVWIVDAKSDKVFRYAGAASRLSGSQNAASSFSLNSGNRDPSDIVTNGTHLWISNNSSTDKVFKYTATGSLVGSWTISGGGGAPTGITIDPANVSDIWIVDANTDRVYRYANAAARSSGSQSAADSFILAAGNTNPQGIADPPPTSGLNAERIGAAHGAPLSGSWVDLFLSMSDETENGNGHPALADLELALPSIVKKIVGQSERTQIDRSDRFYEWLNDHDNERRSRTPLATGDDLPLAIESGDVGSPSAWHRETSRHSRKL